MKIKTNGIELNYVVEGSGPWLVMSHSLACDLTMWDEQAAVLRRNFRVLRFDTRGHGLSDAPEALPLWQGRIKTAQDKGMEALVETTLQRWFTEPFRKTRPEVTARVSAMIRATPVPGYVGCCHAIPQINLTARLKEVKCPSLVIVGEQDAGTPVAMAREIHAALPGSELVVIPSASHLSNLEQPTAFNRALATFLNKRR